MKNRIILICLLMTALLAAVGITFFAGEFSKKETPDPPAVEVEDPAPNVSITVLREQGDKTDTEENEERYPWEQPVVPIAEFSGEMPTIVCWGDSLTESVDGKSYPDFLRKLIQTEVVNYGVRAETTRSIAMREGAVPITVGACVVSENEVPMAVDVASKSGSGIQLLKNGSAGVNPCYIGGVVGTLHYEQTEDRYYFTRAAAGEAVLVEEGSLLTTDGMANRQKDDVLIIFTGTNDGPDTSSIYDIIEIQKAMLDYADCKKYVIIGLTCKKVIPEIEAVNEILAEEYGEHFLDIRSYLLSYGLAEAGLTPTAQDRADLKNGEIPSSLRKDYVHGNAYLYEILAGQVYRKLQYLGYVPNH